MNSLHRASFFFIPPNAFYPLGNPPTPFCTNPCPPFNHPPRPQSWPLKNESPHYASATKLPTSKLKRPLETSTFMNGLATAGPFSSLIQKCVLRVSSSGAAKTNHTITRIIPRSARRSSAPSLSSNLNSPSATSNSSASPQILSIATRSVKNGSRYTAQVGSDANTGMDQRHQ